MRLPDFLLIGSAKSGTTTLFEYLIRHPQIYMGPIKEPGFFVEGNKKIPKTLWQKLLNQPDEFRRVQSPIYSKGLDWYASLFAEAKPSQICGEGTQIYTQWPRFQSARLISETLPNSKFIFIMREPIKRAYSHYLELLKQKHYSENSSDIAYSFEEEIKYNQHVLDTSNYMLQIEQYLKFFKKEQFLFLLMEDLISNPAGVLNEVCRFIGVDEIDLLMNNPVHSNKADAFESQLIKYHTDKIYKLLPNFLKNETSWLSTNYQKKLDDSILTFVKNKYVPKPMLIETQQLLAEKFREPNQRLAEFLGRDLSSWNHDGK